MAPNRDKQRKAARGGYELAYSPKESGRPLQRKLLQRSLNASTDSGIPAASHGHEPEHENHAATPREDRAG